MGNVDPYSLGSSMALLLGLVLVILGIYARRNGKLRYREGAALLASSASLIGALVLGSGVYALLKA